jgi:hypothetical protein
MVKTCNSLFLGEQNWAGVSGVRVASSQFHTNDQLATIREDYEDKFLK